MLKTFLNTIGSWRASSTLLLAAFVSSAVSCSNGCLKLNFKHYIAVRAVDDCHDERFLCIMGAMKFSKKRAADRPLVMKK